jgi:predicted dehydrogenase
MNALAHDGPIRVGIIGGGSIAQAHLDGYLLAGDRARVAAVADIDLEHAQRSADRAGGAEIFSDYRELIASPRVDAVDICLPHHLHADAIVAAAAAGKHVLCEKPLCLTVEEAEAVGQAVTASGITLMCAHNQLFLPAVARARELIQRGSLGTIFGARTTDSFFNDLDPKTIGWRGARATSGGGELIDTGYHPTYLLLHLVDSPAVEVSAMLSRHRLAFLEGEDSAQVLVQFADGSVGAIMTSWAYEPAGCTEKFSVVGDGGSLWSDGQTLHYRVRGAETIVEQFPKPQPHTVALGVVDFIDCLREGRRPLNTQVEGMSVLKVILAAYASAERRQTVALDDIGGPSRRP